MFEQPVGKVEKDRSKFIIGVSAVAVLAVIALIVLVTSLRTSSPKTVQMSEMGSEEFASYAPFISFEVQDKRQGERFNNSKYIRLLCLLKNEGDKVLTGLQVKVMAIRYTGTDGDLSQYEIVKEKIVNPIPSMKESLDPRRSTQLELYMEPLDAVTVDNVLVQVNGLNVK